MNTGVYFSSMLAKLFCNVTLLDSTQICIIPSTREIVEKFKSIYSMTMIQTTKQKKKFHINIMCIMSKHDKVILFLFNKSQKTLMCKSLLQFRCLSQKSLSSDFLLFPTDTDIAHTKTRRRM